MTAPHDHPEIRALDELGRRFEIATARHAPTPRTRRVVLITAIAAMALVGTPAVAAITGTSITGIFNPHSTIEEALPRAAAVIDPADPVATGRALRRLGFDVRWSLVEDARRGSSPTTSRDVGVPPPGTEILSVTAAGGSSKVTADTRVLQIEVAPAGSEILRSHR